MTRTNLQDLRQAVAFHVQMELRAQSGDDATPRQLIDGAFLVLRGALNQGQPIQSAIGAVEANAYRLSLA